jgi:outer membrane lipoprotein-sorting protein
VDEYLGRIKMKKAIVLALLMLCSWLYAQGPSGVEILEKVDRNYEARNRVSVSTMKIHGSRADRTMKSKSWAEGKDNAFTQYLEPAREKDTKMLKLKDELWIWSPGTDRIIKIAGHMLRQSMMGSDVSYEDFMEDPVLSNSYEVKISGEEKVNGRDCYALALTAKKDNLSYFSRKLWVDKERYLPLKEELFAKSGKLLKTFSINEVFQAGTRWYPKRITFKDALKDGSGTEITFDSIDFDAEIPEHIFSKASLRR